MNLIRCINSSEFKKIITKEIAPYLRELGWKGTGYEYKRIKHNVRNGIKFQGSSSGGNFCINLLVQFESEPKSANELIQELNIRNFSVRLTKEENKGDYWWDFPLRDSNYDDLIEDLKETINNNLELFFDKYENWEDKILKTTVDGLNSGELDEILLGTKMTQALICSAFNLNKGKNQAAINFAEYGLTCIKGVVGSGRKEVIGEIIKEASS